MTIKKNVEFMENEIAPLKGRFEDAMGKDPRDYKTLLNVLSALADYSAQLRQQDQEVEEYLNLQDKIQLLFERLMAILEKEYKNIFIQREFQRAMQTVTVLLNLGKVVQDERFDDAMLIKINIKENLEEMIENYLALEARYHIALFDNNYNESLTIISVLLNLYSNLVMFGLPETGEYQDDLKKLFPMVVESFQKFETEFDKGFPKETFQECLTIHTLYMVLALNLKYNDRYQVFQNLLGDILKVINKMEKKFLSLEGNFDKAFKARDLQPCIYIIQVLSVLLDNLDHNDRQNDFEEMRTRIRTLRDDLLNRMWGLEKELKDALAKKDYEKAANTLPALMALAKNVKDQKRVDEFQKILDDLEKAMQGEEAPSQEKYRAEKRFQQLEEAFNKYMGAKLWAPALDLTTELIDLAGKLNRPEKVKEYEELRAKLMDELENLKTRFQQKEEDFQNNFADQKYSECLADIPVLKGLAQRLGDDKAIKKYDKLEKDIKKNILEQERLEAEQKEKRGQIKKLKEDAYALEDRWKFDEAREKYEAAKKIAEEIGDELTIDFVDQKLEQLDDWGKEIEEFDMLKWEIFPFKIINRRRYEFFEIFAKREAAESKMEELLKDGMLPENAHIVNVQRMKFKNQGPFGPDGRCFTIYRRKTFVD